MEPFTRRDLFAAAAAATAGLAAGRPGAAAMPHITTPQSPPQRRKKAVKYDMIATGKSVQEKFALLEDCGFDGVELNSPGDLKLDDVLRAKAATGLEIPGVVDSVHWNQPLSDPDPQVRKAGVDALATALRDAKAYGGTSVLLVPAVIKKNVGYLDAWQRSQQEIKKVLPLAAELQIQILIENVWNRFLLGPTELQRYVDEFASDQVGVHFDAGNLVTFGFPEHWVPILGKRIKKVDVKDFKRGQVGFDVKLNDGDADWPAIIKALDAIGYAGWFTAEVAAGDGTYLKDLAQRMDSFLQA